MKYTGMPTGMWLLFSGSFRKQLEEVLGYSREEACKITVNAKRQYRKLIGKLPEFERKDRFKMNIVNCAMLSAFLLISVFTGSWMMANGSVMKEVHAFY